MHQTSEHNGPVVCSAEQHSTPTRQRRELSVKLMAYAGAAVIIALFLAITAANLVLTRNHYQPAENEAIQQHLSDKAESIHGQLALLSQIVANVAVQPTTQDILEYNDSSGAQAWALQMRRFLPQATGVALLAEDGRVLGEPAGHQLGPQCLSDLVRLSQGENVATPPVHRRDPRSQHYDLTAPVLDEAENPSGTLIVSFRLDSLRKLVKNSADANQNLVLRDGHGEVIAQQININGEHNTHSSTLTIDGTHWQLSLTEKSPASLPSFFSLVTFNISALLLTVSLVIFLLRFATHRLHTDFEHIKGLLNQLMEGKQPDNDLPAPQLRETAEILPSINRIHHNLDKKRQLIERHQLTDPLTGLPNRRQFDIDFARAYDFARRGSDVCTAVLQLSGLEPLTPEQQERATEILGHTLRDNARTVDYVARLENGQFALLMFGIKAKNATPSVERLHALFLRQQKQHSAIEDQHICSFCCGYTLIHGHRDNNVAEVLERARDALAKAEASASQQIING